MKQIGDVYYKRTFGVIVHLIQEMPERFDDGLGTNLDLSLLDWVTSKIVEASDR